MEQPGHVSSSVSSPQISRSKHSRNVWILTGYGISGLVLFVILAYYFSGFVTH